MKVVQISYYSIYRHLTKEDVERKFANCNRVQYAGFLPFLPFAAQEFRSVPKGIAGEEYKRVRVMFGFTGVFAQKRLHGKSGVVHTLITP